MTVDCGIDGVGRRAGGRRADKLTARREAVALAREMRASGLAVTLVVHEHRRLGRGIELATFAELRAAGIGLQFLAGELQGSHDPTGIVFTVMSRMETERIRDLTPEGHEAARARGKNIGAAAAVTDEAMPCTCATSSTSASATSPRA